MVRSCSHLSKSKVSKLSSKISSPALTFLRLTVVMDKPFSKVHGDFSAPVTQIQMNYQIIETQLSDSPKAAPTTTAKTKKKRIISRCCGEQLVDLPRWLCVYIVGGWIKKCALSEGRSEFEIRSLTFIVDLCDRHMWNMSISRLILSHCWLTNKVSSISARVTWQVNGQPFYDVICRLLMRL